MMNGKRKPLSAVLKIYLICCIFRAIEYFILRTDQTIFGEAFVHKLAGIFILFAGIKLFKFKAKEIGFDKDKTIQYIAKGLAFGAVTFILAYSAEVLMLALQGKFTGLALYVSAYAVDGNIGHRTAPVFFAFCMIGNIINVVMEEGIFRGLFPRLLEQRYTRIISAVIASSLFGLWHIMAPIRNYCDGTMSLEGLIANSVMLAVTTCLIGVKFAMITKLTGNLYMAMGDHFFNNTIVNILHVISITGADELMVFRISIAQSISFIAVLLWCFAVRHKKCSVAYE
ncbi:type II CAAX endopeptidase family protein [Stomatobaculum longum]|uniref:CPBP family intramembrane glutamic endopeptidase n=1 Tax=Stomatobaculum longum TaxID=796942 RepID=UPI002803BBB0|nr:type II CAAX endopeptidase family protein [Stomatobaculum longum]